MTSNSRKSSTFIIGLGRSGIGAAKLLKENGQDVTIIEQQKGATYETIANELSLEGIEVCLGKPLEIDSFSDSLNFINTVIISPGIPWDHPTLEQLRRLGIKVKGEIGLAWEELSHIPWIGVTGTNGKTTVAHLMRHVLEGNNFHTPIGGNVGYAATEIALEYKKSNSHFADLLIMELSSFQIETAPEISPSIGIWTNLTPDHLDRHKTLNNYRKIKQSLLENSKVGIYNADDKIIYENREELGEGTWISAERRSFPNPDINFWIDHKGFIFEGNQELFNSSCLHIPGDHNIQNLLLVTAAAREIGLSSIEIKNTLSSFKGVPHRLEMLARFNSFDIYNDSKATNYDSSSIALKSLASPTILIAGGLVKKGDSSEWLKQINLNVCGVILFGNGVNQLSRKIKASGYQGKLISCLDLSEAVEISFNLAIEENANSLVLSPACASFDQYKNFEERGNHFKDLIVDLLRKR